MIYREGIYDQSFQNELTGMECDYEVWQTFVVDAILYEYLLEHVSIAITDESDPNGYKYEYRVICRNLILDSVNRKLHMVGISRLSSMDASIEKYLDYLVKTNGLEKLTPYPGRSDDLDEYYILTSTFLEII